MNNVEIQKGIEQSILYFLKKQLDAHTNQPDRFGDSVTRLELYGWISREKSYHGHHMTAGTYNFVIGQLKKIGLIGTAKGGQVLFLVSSNKAAQS